MFASAIAAGCTAKRLFWVYYLPVIKRETGLGFVTIFLIAIYAESALSYCKVGVSRFTHEGLMTLGSFIKLNLPPIIKEPFLKLMSDLTPSLCAAGILLFVVFTALIAAGRLFPSREEQ